MQDILTWLNTPPLTNLADELSSLHANLSSFREKTATTEERTSALTLFFSRTMSAADALTPKLSSTSLPIPRKARQLVRTLQNLLHALATDFLNLQSQFQAEPSDDSQLLRTLALQNSLTALGQHLAISDLVASPSGAGIWLQLHQTYEKARQLDLENATSNSNSRSPQQIYYAAVLLGCAQPASFTSREVAFVAANLDLFASQVELIDATTTEAPEAFWIDPARDAPATACARKPAPPGTLAYYFSCAKIAGTLRKQLSAIESDLPTPLIKAPEFARTNAGRGVLRRLIANWGEPGKRRFSRRRQNDRADLCVGLDSLWRLFQDETTANIETSSWMITNQSPDGYAVMHLSGKADNATVGDLCAVHTDTEEKWKVCIIRWALSENQEHLELGLQILATDAVPAFLAQPNLGENPTGSHPSVLILPGTPPLRSSEMLVAPSGALESHSRNLILIIEKENIGIREVKSTYLDEQNSQIEVFAIEPNETPS